METAKTARPPIAGRWVERDALRRLLGDARAGHGGVALIEGPAGIGKTRIIDDLLDGAAQDGFAVLVGGGDPLDQGRPFGALADALGVRVGSDDRRKAELARSMVVGVHQGDRLERAPVTEYVVLEELVALVEDVWASSPSVLVIDNVHWADPSTITCLRRLVRLVPQHPAMLVLATRPDDRPEAAQLSLAAQTVGVRLLVGPLGQDEIDELVANTVGAAPGPNLRARLARAGGNPLFLAELLASFRERGLLTTRDAVADVEPDAPSVSLELTILDRVSMLPSAAVELLRLAAVIGPTFAVDDLSLLSGRSAVELTEPLRAAARAGVIVDDDDDRFAFRHDLVQQALHDDIPGPVRRALHRDLGRALAAVGAPPARVAPHLALGAEVGDADAIEWLHRAGREVAPHAPATAVELLQQARALAGPSGPTFNAVGFDLALALIWAGRHAEGEACGRAVLARGVDPDTHGRLAVMVGASLFTRAAASEAAEVVEQALAAGITDPTIRLRVRLLEVSILLASAQAARAIEQGDELLVDARRVGDRVALLECLTVLATAASIHGELDAAERYGVEALRVAEEVPPAERARSHPDLVVASFVLVEQDRLDEAEAMIRRGTAVSEGLGGRPAVALHRTGFAYIDFLSGRWDDALAELDTVLGLYEEDEPAHPADPLSLRALIELHRGDVAAAEVDLEEAKRRALTGSVYWPDRLLLADALVHAASGRTAEALDGLVGAWQLVSAVPLPMAMPGLGPDVARVCVAAGDHETATAVAAAVGGVAAANPGVVRLAAVADWCAGLAAGAPDLVITAVDRLRAGPRTLERSQACEDAAALLAGAGRAQEARRLLSEAVGGYEAMGASARVATAAARLRALGVRLGQRGARGRPSSGWGALTDTERKVAALVAEGLSNPEIGARMVLSRRTIETHVSHILAKLGVVSRRQLAAEVVRHR